jgi:hypothetical protein
MAPLLAKRAKSMGNTVRYIKPLSSPIPSLTTTAISAQGIRMNFIPYGASVSNLFINDSRGIERDVVLGFDNATAYTLDTAHPHLGGVPGEIDLCSTHPTTN